MIEIQNRSGCCKYCKKADTCILSAIFPLVHAMGYEDVSMQTDIYAAVETVLNDKYHIYCTAGADSCPYCIAHKDSGCYGDEYTGMMIELNQFLKMMDTRFSDYAKDGIMESYVYDQPSHAMFISKEDYDKDHGYIWAALDGAVGLWNMQNDTYYISFDEDAPDEDGMIMYSFEINKKKEGCSNE